MVVLELKVTATVAAGVAQPVAAAEVASVVAVAIVAVALAVEDEAALLDDELPEPTILMSAQVK